MKQVKQTVYRIERDKSKEGMYTCITGKDWYSITNGAQTDRHPTPWEDSLLRANIIAAGYSMTDIACEMHYGFISIEQLRTWIYKDEWLKGLSDNGFILAEYRSEEVFVGNTQAIFYRGPRRHRKHNIKKYFNLEGE